MKKIFNSLVMILFITAVSAPIFADQAKMSATPVAKAIKHIGTNKHKKAKKGKTSMKPKSTPVAK